MKKTTLKTHPARETAVALPASTHCPRCAQIGNLTRTLETFGPAILRRMAGQKTLAEVLCGDALDQFDALAKTHRVELAELILFTLHQKLQSLGVAVNPAWLLPDAERHALTLRPPAVPATPARKAVAA